MQKFLAALLVLLLLPVTAHAFIVDTGTPTNDFSGNLLVGDGQFLASRFQLDQAYSVTSMEGYFNTLYNYSDNFNEETFGYDGTLTAVLYGGDGGTDPDFGGLLPNTANELYSAAFDVNYTQNPDFTYDGWFGVSDANLTLDPGAYWLAFEYRPGNTLVTSAMPTEPPAPLDGAWYQDGAYHNFPGATNIGVRVDGAPVPEPGSMVLLSMGLAGMLGGRMKNFLKKIRKA